MGLLDDLAMGFGLKERTEDYDARTARNIAVSEQYDNEFDRIRARQSGDYDVTRGGAAQFLGSRGRDNYNPQIAQDNRSFGQRFLFSPESAPSPTPYAIGPLTMDQPLPKFGILGMLSGLGGLLGGNTQRDPSAAINVANRAMRNLPAPDNGSAGEPEVGTPAVTPKDYSVYGGIDFPMYIPGAPAAPSVTPKDYSVYGGTDFPMPAPPAPTLEAGILSEPTRTTAGTYTAAYEPDSDLARINEKMLNLYPNFYDMPESRRQTLIDAARRLGY